MLLLIISGKEFQGVITSKIGTRLHLVVKESLSHGKGIINLNASSL